MDQIRIHGRGGQGSVTLAHLIADAAHEEGDWAQAFPSFGVERRGAPIRAFARIDEDQITDRSHVEEPNHVIVQDDTLLEFVDVTGGLADGGTILVNSTDEPEELPIETDGVVETVDATEIALEHLGQPIMNTALLGAFARMTDLVTRDSVETVIKAEWPGETGDQNIAASADAFKEAKPA